MWMPETNGLEVQARLREVSPDTKVIVMTGRETPAIHGAALVGGASAFLVKPFDDDMQKVDKAKSDLEYSRTMGEATEKLALTGAAPKMGRPDGGKRTRCA